jgi:hypothetical protein
MKDSTKKGSEATRVAIRSKKISSFDQRMGVARAMSLHARNAGENNCRRAFAFRDGQWFKNY